MLTRKTLVFFGMACVAGLLLPALARDASSSKRLPLDAHRALGTPRTFRNLTLIPVYDARATTDNRCITLDEGLKSGLVKVKESPNGGEVNTLYLTNLSKRPLYIMAGEVVLGGQQDRTVGSDLLLAAGKKQEPITVFCVEHGRWTGQTNFSTSALTVASADIRANAQDGAFANAAPVAAPALEVSATGGRPAQQRTGAALHRPRIAANLRAAAPIPLGQAQQMVWDKVEAKNHKFKAGSESGTYRTVLNLANGDTQQSISPYIKALSTRLGNDPHLVGAVAIINGKVVAADVFGNTTLFRKLWPKLLRSYAADAAENAPSGRGKWQPASAQAARRFLIQAAAGGVKAEAHSHLGVIERRASEKTVRYSFAAGGFGGAAPVHENALQK